MKTQKKLPKIINFGTKTAPEKAVALKVVPGSFPSVKKASREDAGCRKLRAMIIVPAVALSLLGLVKFLHSLLLPLTGTDDKSFIKLLLLFQLYLLLDLIIILR